MSGANVILIASSDDFLLEEAVVGEVAACVERLGDAPVVELGEETTPEAAAMELTSPSLFDPRRVLVMANAMAWVNARPPAGAAAVTPMDPDPLVHVLDAGLGEDIALVLGVWSGGRPSGPLVDAMSRAGRVQWIPVPPPPKPWEDVVLSPEQVTVLRGVIERSAGDARFDPAAERLLLERLGFAPRLLAQEVRKLVTAAGTGTRIDEALVRRLTFPSARSLDGVRDAILARRAEPIVDLLAAAEAGIPVRDWRGQPLPVAALPALLLGQVANLLEKLLYLHRALHALGAQKDLSAARTGGRRWYARRFKPKGGLGEQLLAFVRDDPASPFSGKKKLPTMWSLSKLVEGAGRYREEELIGLLSAAGDVEGAIRREGGLNAMMAWLIGALASRPAPT